MPFRFQLAKHRSRAVKPPPIISLGLGSSYKYGPGQPKDRPVTHSQSNLSTVHFAAARLILPTMKVLAFVLLVLAVSMVSAKPSPQGIHEAIFSVINNAVPVVQPGSFNRPPPGGISSFASAQQNTGPTGQNFFAAQTGVAQGSSASRP